MKRKNKRGYVSRMMQIWLKANSRGKLAYDQWMELVTLPLVPMLLASIPAIILFAFSPVGTLRIIRLARFGGVVVFMVLVLIIGALIARGMRLSRLPVVQETLYAGAESSLFSRFQNSFVMYTVYGDPITFDTMLRGRPDLLADEPYVVHYLQDEERRTLVSYGIAHHPNAEEWTV